MKHKNIKKQNKRHLCTNVISIFDNLKCNKKHLKTNASYKNDNYNFIKKFHKKFQKSERKFWLDMISILCIKSLLLGILWFIFFRSPEQLNNITAGGHIFY